jgi:Ca-activated chloride channel homolog
MSFLWPVMLWSLLLVPLGIGLYLLLQRRRHRVMTHFGELGFAQQGRQFEARRHIPPTILLLSLTIMFVGSARPSAVVSLPKVQGIVILAFDVSASMAAEDLTPNRIEAAKAAALDFVKNQPPTIQIGVVAFSDSGLSVQPPTDDRKAIEDAIQRLSPQRGTSLGNGILAALKLITIAQSDEQTNYYSNLTPVPTSSPTPFPTGIYSSAVVILLTDGENNANPDPLLAAQSAAERGVRIHTVGIGSLAGADLQLEGFIVHTQMDEDLMKQISEMSGGQYYLAENTEALKAIYDELNTQFVIRPEETELTSIFAGLGILTLLIGSMFSFLWFNRLP